MKYQKAGEVLTAIVKIDNVNRMFFASKIQSNKKNDCDGCFAKKQSREFCFALHKALTDVGFPDCNRGWAYKAKQTITKTAKKRHSKYKQGHCDFKNGKECHIPSGKSCPDLRRVNKNDQRFEDVNLCNVGDKNE